MSQAAQPEANPHLYVTLAVDMGAKYTGTFYISHDGNEPKAGDCQAMTLVMPEDGDKMTFSAQARRAVRHRLRSKKRFALARRLALLIIRKTLEEKAIVLDAQASRKLTESICGLLRRRGYSRLEADTQTDLSILESIDPAVFANHSILGQLFHDTADIATQWENLTQDLSKVSQLLKSRPDDKSFKAYLSTEFPEYKAQAKSYSTALKILTDEGHSLLQQARFGHRHRKEYLREIYEDMQKDSRLQPAVRAFGDVTRLWRLIGNLSNLQLRAVRWYFNAPELFDDRHWKPERLQKTLVRAFKYFHVAKGQPAQEQQQLIQRLESAPDIIDALCSIDPADTIPPYENQNNRRPPVDQTLYLSPKRLTENYGDIWKSWAAAFVKHEPTLDDNLEEILVHTDRRSRVKALCADAGTFTALDYRFSYILQRVLDRNKKLDRYALRLLVQNTLSQSAEKGRRALADTIGPQHLDAFLTLARTYYEEVAHARDGLWLPSQAKLLEKSDIHPPMKQKMLPQLVGDIFGLDADFGRTFITKYWEAKLSEKSRSSLRSSCQFIETIRKQYGGEFALAYKDACQKLNKKEKIAKELKQVIDRLQAISTYLRDSVKLPANALKRVSNPFSCAQLYTLIELDRSGFSSTTIAAQLENAWRMTQPDGMDCAQCSRLPADAVRPFDGIMRKVLERQAEELARKTVADIKAKALRDNTVINLAVIVEENKFAFTASLATLKKNTRARKKAEDALARQTTRWLSKEERIKAASRNLCAYSGSPIDGVGEIDHIIPRSLTNACLGTAFNSEANLIYVSQAGNQIKKDQRYRLNHLSDHYLDVVFNTHDIALLTERIEARVAELQSERRLRHFDLLSQHDQDIVRHALFLNDDSDARKLILSELATTNRTRVNGAQAWFIRCYLNKVMQMSGTWLDTHHHTLNYAATRINAMDASPIREALGKHQTSFAKPEFQPVASHSIDAMCAYAVACASDRFCQFTHSNPSLVDTQNIRQLCELYPNACQVRWITALPDEEKTDHDSRGLFKEGILAENFLPLLTHNGEVYIGFTLPNRNDEKSDKAVRVIGSDPFALLHTLSDYLNTPVTTTDDSLKCYRIQPQKAFALYAKAFLSPEQLSPSERASLPLLDALHYITERVPVKTGLISKNGKSFVKDGLNLGKAPFDISLSLKQKSYKAEGLLTLPAKADWEKILNHPDLQDKLGQYLKDVPDFDIDEWLKIQHGMNRSNRSHTAVRRIASLPVISKDSGGFRIRRKTLDGRSVYQLHNIANAKYLGFALDEKQQVDWQKPVLLPHLSHANLTSKKWHETTRADNVVKMRDFRHIQTVDNIVVSMAPGSEGRRYIRLQMPFETLVEWLKCAEADCQPTHFLRLDSDIKLAKPKAFVPASLACAELLGSPRSHLFVETVGEIVRFWYIVESSNTAMKQAYNQARS